MSPLTKERLRSHPELAALHVLSAQLDLLPQLFAAVHGPDERGALPEQARSIARVCRVLADQTRAYVGLVETDIDGQRTRRYR